MNNQTVLLDSCYWIALYLEEEEDDRGEKAKELADLMTIQTARLCLPWPTLYEFVNSKLGRRDTLDQFQKVITSPNVVLLSDSIYKELALQNVLNRRHAVHGDISLVDEVIRLIILDPDVNVKYFASFDQPLRNFALAHNKILIL